MSQSDLIYLCFLISINKRYSAVTVYEDADETGQIRASIWVFNNFVCLGTWIDRNHASRRKVKQLHDSLAVGFKQNRLKINTNPRQGTTYLSGHPKATMFLLRIAAQYPEFSSAATIPHTKYSTRHSAARRCVPRSLVWMQNYFQTVGGKESMKGESESLRCEGQEEKPKSSCGFLRVG